MGALLVQAVELLGGVAGIVAISAYCAKKATDHFLAREAEKFKADLARDNQIEIERIKGELQRQHITHQVRFSKLHESQSAVLDEGFRKLSAIHTSFSALVSPLAEMKLASPDEQWNAYLASVKEFGAHIQSSELYYPTNLYGQMLRYVVTVGMIATEYQQAPAEERHFQGVIERVMREVVPIYKSIHAECQRLLGIEATS